MKEKMIREKRWGKRKSVEGLLFIVLICKSAEVSFPCEIVGKKLFTGEPSGLPGASFPRQRSRVLWQRSGGATFKI